VAAVSLALFPANAEAQGLVGAATNWPPKITQQPTPLTVEQGQTATFRVAVEIDSKNSSGGLGTYTYPTPTYQWFKNTVRVLGANNSTLALTNAQVTDSGNYFVVVTNKIGWVASSTVSLSVIVTSVPTIVTQPGSASRQRGESFSLSVAAVGVPTPTYRWRKNGGFVSGATTSQLSFASLEADDAGTYDVVISNSRGSIVSRSATISVATSVITPARTVPTIISQPANYAGKSAQTATLTVSATGEMLTYQWRKNGVAIAGATESRYTKPSVADADMGFYSVVIASGEEVLESEVAILTVESSGSSRLTNLSTRGYVTTGGTLTVGLSIRGTGSKQLLARAVGPTLTRFGVTGILTDPMLAIIAAGTTTPISANDNWASGNLSRGATDTVALMNATKAVGAFPLDNDSTDAAVLASVATLGNANYTIVVSGGDPQTEGVVLAEIYDGDGGTHETRLAALSTLGMIGRGERALVPGFTIAGTAAKRLLIRAVGPSLEQFGISGAVANPTLAIVASAINRVVPKASADQDTSAVARAAVHAGAFPLHAGSKDTAMVVQLPPGSYTLMVAGDDNGTGTVLVEIYDLDA
jgi:hypothetical protein